MGIFRFGRGDASSILGPLEDDVMKLVWSAKTSVTVADIHFALEKQGRELAYSTIKAVLTNLAAKGYLRKRSKGKANVFAPAITEERFRERVVSSVLDALTQDYRNPLIVSLVDRLGADPKMLSELERLVALKKSEGKRHG
jgi:BlaI family transcriptional regulator, penicillinase repressor